MRLSPFEAAYDDHWLNDAPLYGRPGLRNPRGSYSFEVFPARTDDDLSRCHLIPRNEEECDWSAIGFEIPKATAFNNHVLMINTYDRPRLQWYTPEEFEKRYLYDPRDPPRPRGVRPKTWERRVSESFDPSVRITEDRRTLLRRITRLWNGDVVCGVHLLADRCPTIKHITHDLDETELNRLYYNTRLGHDTLLAFSDADWFETTTGFLKSTTLFRKQAWYDLNDKARTHINESEEYPTLHGDPHEGLTHRVTVGLVRLHDTIRGWNGASYYDWNGYTIDALTNDQRGQSIAREVLTGHNNWKLHRATYRKLRELDRQGAKPIVVFDTRRTAYRVFNHWHNWDGLGNLPNGTFGSEFSISAGRDRIQDAYDSDEHDWAVADWTTTWRLKQDTLGADAPELTRDQITSVNW